MIESYPLSWPGDFPRSERQYHSQFSCTISSASRKLFAEIKRLGGTLPVLSSNVPLKRDGMPYSSGLPKGESSGVAVYFQYRGKQMVFACDRWIKVEDNIQAIWKTIEAMRGMERWGCSDLLERAFLGFKALPETASGKSWYDVLEVRSDASKEVIQANYRAMVKVYHPDNQLTGDNKKFIDIKTAYDQAMAQFRS